MDFCIMLYFYLMMYYLLIVSRFGLKASAICLNCTINNVIHHHNTTSYNKCREKLDEANLRTKVELEKMGLQITVEFRE